MIKQSIEVRITIDGDDFSVFQGLFAYGFRVNIEAGATLFDILCRQIGISETYINDRVQTVFLNGKAVDDPAREIVKDNDVIALSAAMPGLAGAVFRKGGMLSAMRSENSYQSAGGRTERSGQITIKLFNLIALDLGPALLENGILICREQLIRYIKWKKSRLRTACKKIRIDGRQIDIDNLEPALDSENDIRFFVNAA